MSWWSLSFMGITMTGRYPLKILIWGSGWLPLCVKVQGVLPQSRVTQTSEIWFLFEMLFLSWNFLPTLCWLGCCLIFLGMSLVLWQYHPIFVPGIGVTLSNTGLLFQFWPQSSISWIFGITYPLGWFDRCGLWFCVSFCRIRCCPFQGCLFSPPPLGGIDCSHDCISKKKVPAMSWTMANLTF